MVLDKSKRPNKELGLLGVFAIAIGSTLGAGLFLLPGIAAASAGPGMVFSYLVAALLMVPPLISMIELATAMPRSGGFYYFLDRSMGPLAGTIGGMGFWVALTLNTALALVGIGIYLSIFLPEAPVRLVAAGMAVLIGFVNLRGIGKSALLQVGLMAVLLGVLVVFLGAGIPKVDPGRLSTVLTGDWMGIMGTAGLVYMSFIGLTSIAGLSEEVKNPERALPLGTLLGFITVVVIYFLCTIALVGILPADVLSGDAKALATAAESAIGRWATMTVAVAALLSFLFIANAGIRSASRYPLAMSRDRLLPRFLKQLDKSKAPYAAILVTVGLIVLSVLLFDAALLAKLASVFLLVVFILTCAAVIIMRESRIQSYDPGFASPLYPWTQIIGVIGCVWLLTRIGGLAQFVAVIFSLAAFGWYYYYARSTTKRTGAIFEMFRRLGDQSVDEGLDGELREILQEKGKKDDPFEEVLEVAHVLDIGDDAVEFEDLVDQVSQIFDPFLPASREDIAAGFVERSRLGATPVTSGVSIPHLKMKELERPLLCLVRSRTGIELDIEDVSGEHTIYEDIHAFFFLVSPEDKPRQHLRMLTNIAERVDDDDFMDLWRYAKNDLILRDTLRPNRNTLTFVLEPGQKGSELINSLVRDINLPGGALLAMVQRGGETIIPGGDTRLEQGDRLTILGEADVRIQLVERYLSDGGARG